MLINTNHFLQEQIAQEQDRSSVYNTIPVDIRTTLDDMAYGIAMKENLEPFIVKQRMVSKLNMISKDDIVFLLENLSLLIQKSVHDGETIDDKNVSKDFVSFLIGLYY